MMKKSYFIGILCLSTLAFSTSNVYAQSRILWKDQFYVRGDIGASIPAKKFKNANENDPYITKKPKNTAIYNIGVGYKITNNIRSDLNLSYRNFRYKAQDADLSVSQKIKSYAVFLNGYYDFININKIFKPYVTAGIGYGQNKATSLAERGTPSRDYPGSKKNNFIWNVGLGTKLVINQMFNLDIAYRYVDLGKVKTKINSGAVNFIPSTQKMRAHEVTGGIIINI